MNTRRNTRGPAEQLATRPGRTPAVSHAGLALLLIRAVGDTWHTIRGPAGRMTRSPRPPPAARPAQLDHPGSCGRAAPPVRRQHRRPSPQQTALEHRHPRQFRAGDELPDLTDHSCALAAARLPRAIRAGLNT
jgi:hypothetical protein